jgi:hypothetical protein
MESLAPTRSCRGLISAVLPVPAPVMVAVPVYVMAMRIDPVTETIVPWSGEVMVRVDVSPAVVVAVTMVTMMVSVVRVTATI